ncbi:Chloroperoxidase, partial [Chytriomyces sp. MP71]
GQWQAPGPNDKRSPCPAVNSLTNHGYLPRDGLGVTVDMIHTAFQEVLGVDPLIVQTITDNDFKLDTDNSSLVNIGVLNAAEFNATPQFLNLDDLKKHNKNEHDASFSRLDAYFNASQDLNMELFQRLYNASADGKVLNKYDANKHRVQLVKECREYNPTCKFGAQELIIETGETAFLLHILGHKGEITLDHLYSFLVLEQIPTD